MALLPRPAFPSKAAEFLGRAQGRGVGGCSTVRLSTPPPSERTAAKDSCVPERAYQLLYFEPQSTVWGGTYWQEMTSVKSGFRYLEKPPV